METADGAGGVRVRGRPSPNGRRDRGCHAAPARCPGVQEALSEPRLPAGRARPPVHRRRSGRLRPRGEGHPAAPRPGRVPGGRDDLRRVGGLPDGASPPGDRSAPRRVPGQAGVLPYGELRRPPDDRPMDDSARRDADAEDADRRDQREGHHRHDHAAAGAPLMPLLKRHVLARGGPTRLFYACDIHGSEPTYRKFLNAAKFYEVDALVFGGDLMGKLLIPMVRDAGGTYRARLSGQDHHITSDEEMARFKKVLQTLGFYWQEMDPDEYGTYVGNQEKIDALFDVLAKQRLAEWVTLAEERLAGTDVTVYLCGGNDDTDEVLSALDETARDRVVNCENRIVPLDDEHVMATVGYSTPTPWDTPRERSDEQIGELIEKLVADVPDPSRCVFNFHCPPLDSSLDTCMKLDASVWPPAPVIENGQPVSYGAGSRSVADALARYQPTVGLHGHIHESRGATKYGRTPAYNPGSEYGEGVLRGLIVAIRGGEVVGQQFTSG